MIGAGFFVVSLLAAAAASPAPSPSPEPNEAVVESAAGSFVIRLLPDLAPAHVKHFIKTARAGGYDGTTFHRIVTRGIIQGGDPLSKDPKQAARYGTGGLGLLRRSSLTAPSPAGRWPRPAGPRARTRAAASSSSAWWTSRP